MTSYSSQGQTADRVLIHIDTAHAGEALVNRWLAYVARPLLAFIAVATLTMAPSNVVVKRMPLP